MQASGDGDRASGAAGAAGAGMDAGSAGGAAGVSRRMVVNVEQGAANPSVGTLLRISDALGDRPAGLGRAAAAQAGDRHPRAVRAPCCGPARPAAAGCWWPGPSRRTWWSCGTGRWARRPARQRGPHRRHQGTGPRAGGHGDRRGRPDEAVTLEVGDAVSFPGDWPTPTPTPARGPARFSLAVFEPGVGPGTGRRARHD